MSDNLPKISIVVPIFNGEATLNKCLSWLLNQDYPRYEIIAVDNNSSDETKKIITDMASNFPKIIYVFEEKKGRGVARNTGLRAASGEIIVTTDVDCFGDKTWLKKISAPIIYDNQIAVCGFESDATGNYWSRCRQKDDEIFIKSKIDGHYLNHLDTKNFAIRSDILKATGFNTDLSACEDFDLFIRLHLQNIKIYFLGDLLVSHQHDASARAAWRTQFRQGQSMAEIASIYNKEEKLQEIISREQIFKPVSLLNFLFFIPWVIWQFIFHFTIAPYRVLADFSWKLGVLSFKLKKTSAKS